MGNVVTAAGLKPCPEKVTAICNMPMPHDKTSLQRFLGMTRYLAQFIPNESSITAPLRSLLKKDSHWHWSTQHTDAIARIRDAIAQPTLLRFFDTTKEAIIQTDASQSGLGSCLLQEGKPIAFASRSLTPAEENYSQIEKELLAICFACAKFHQYAYGREIEVHTDHRPLETIFKKPLAKAAPRLQRMLLQLQRYTLKVTYVPGRLLYVADTLSRAYVKDNSTCGAADDVEVMVHLLNDSLSPAKRQAFKDATASDPTMRLLSQIISKGWPKSRKSVHSDLQLYWHIRDELHEIDDLLFFGERLLVPTSLRAEMLQVIHESHLGMQKCKARAREVLYWPGMSADIEAIVRKCEICTAMRPDQVKEPLLPHEIPDRPWKKIAADIMTLDSKDYLVVSDYYSKYPEIAHLERKTASCVILHLKSIMARHGIPEELCTDNVPFNSAEFLRFAKDWNFTLTTSSPTYPQSNGKAEKTVQTVKHLLTKAALSGRDPYIALLEYRNTPVSGMSLSPAQMLMSRRLRSKLPTTAKLLKPAVVNAKPLLERQQQKQKYHYDKGAKKLSVLAPGDSVHVRQGKFWKPAVVVKKLRQPRSYLVSCAGTQLRRNRRHLLHTPAIPAPDGWNQYLDDGPDFPVPQNPPAGNADHPDHVPDAHVPQAPLFHEEERENDNDQTDNDQQTVDQQPNHRPARVRNAPSYLKDYVVTKK
jgi:hypothetical protein